jgi:tetratricopeptide (TPR) repeat protein
MLSLKKYIFFFLLLLTAYDSQGQEAAFVDSVKAELAKVTSAEDKVRLLDELSKAMMNISPQQADEYGQKLIVVAEESRDRKLMVKAYLSNGTRCSYFAVKKEYLNKAIEFFNTALKIAQQNRLDEETGGIQLQLAGIYLTASDHDKALSYATQAFSLISTLPNDSLRAEAHNTYGFVYKTKNEKILALRNFLNALRIAESINNNELIRNCYIYLSDFYSSIEDYDKAIDYFSMAYKKLDIVDEKNVPYQRVVYINSIGDLFAKKKSYDIAISHFERSIAMADSLKFSNLKIPGYVSLLNQYLRMDQPGKALTYMNSPRGENLKKYLGNFGMSSIIDNAYAVIYRDLGQFDSADYYFNKAKPAFEKSNSEASNINFYGQLAKFYKVSGNNQKAVEYYLKVKEMSDKIGLLENIQGAAKNLDTLYTRLGNFQLAGKYNAVYYQYKDSIDKQNREKELAQVEADDEQQRQTKLQKEKDESDKRRKSTQLIAIAIFIAVLFTALVMLGMFKVSKSTIRSLGFFAFIMLFEFIFLVFKKNIAGITKGEPWKDLSFMIALAALLVPLHHWLEHKVIHYLTSHNRLTTSGQSLLSKLKRTIKPAKPAANP